LERRPPEIEPLLAALEQGSVRFVLVGSVAAMAHGISASPGDLDITPALDRDNLDRLAGVLGSIGARLPEDDCFGEWEQLPDGQRRWVELPSTPERIAARAAWRPDPDDPASFDHLFVTRHGNFDVVPDLSGTYEQLLLRSVALEFHKHTVHIASVPDLLAALTVPRRSKDASRVHQLWDVLRAGNDRSPD
jgi:hypothetical protein